MKQICFIFILTIIIIVSISLVGYAQNPITAQVDHANLATGEVLLLTVTVESQSLNPPQPFLPSLDGFDIIGTSTSSQISLVNNVISSKGTYRYQLQPTMAGDLIIPPITVTIDGQTYDTEPINIVVTQGTTPSQSSPVPDSNMPSPGVLEGQDVFIEAEVDNPTPYFGEQIIYTFRFYYSIRLTDSPNYTAPSFKGFWSESQNDQNRYAIMNDRRRYEVVELHTILFPTLAGSVDIEPASLAIRKSIFQAPRMLHTDKVTLDVQHMPENAPDDFNGAVGQFNIMSTVDSRQGKVNEPLTLIVTLDGKGNIANLPDPIWIETDGWRTFDEKATINTTVEDNQLTGSRVYERLMVPSEAGEATIPPISYTYFDPTTGTYETTSTDPIPVSIALGASEAPTPIVLDSNREIIEREANDIRHVKSVPPVLSSGNESLTKRWWYWFTWGIPGMLLFVNFAWQKWQRHARSNIAVIRRLNAAKNAQQTLKTARNKNSTDLYQATGDIILTYLSDKCNQSMTGLTQTAMIDMLQVHGVSHKRISQIQAYLAESDMGRFAPEGNTSIKANRLLDKTVELIDALEKEFES
ncbi:MAG: hypothetical protein B6242_07360 [Anaerolineaceae bacterium 4572_78]|nr:MAG: hypothetical protein B6242_07360 [Anaerolineaceae bacterium 4572_78]